MTEKEMLQRIKELEEECKTMKTERNILARLGCTRGGPHHLYGNGRIMALNMCDNIVDEIYGGQK